MGCDMSFIKRAALSGASKGGEEEKFEKRILLLGLDNAGKTSLLFHIRDNQFRDTVPTVGLNIELISYKRYSLTFWDVGGQATKLWKHYFDHIEGVVFVVDSTDEERLMLAKEELRRLLNSGNSTAASSQNQASEGLGDVPFLLLYNKRDLLNAKTGEELSGRLEVESYREAGR
jgi:ADP-ribosylation factor 1/2